jgi:hypothetical protein
MPNTKRLTKDDYIATGKRYTSEEVLKEANIALTRWETDLALLTKWNLGKKKLLACGSLVQQLTERLEQYKIEVGQKLAAVPKEASLAEELRDWSLRGLALLHDRIQESDDVQTAVEALASELPSDPFLILSYAKSLLKILKDERPNIDPDAIDDEFFATADELIKALPEASKVKLVRRDTKEVSTAELDELDGRIYEQIKLLNENARRAHKQNQNEKRALKYKFYYLTKDPSTPEPETPTTQPTLQ